LAAEMRLLAVTEIIRIANYGCFAVTSDRSQGLATLNLGIRSEVGAALRLVRQCAKRPSRLMIPGAQHTRRLKQGVDCIFIFVLC